MRQRIDDALRVLVEVVRVGNAAVNERYRLDEIAKRLRQAASTLDALGIDVSEILLSPYGTASERLPGIRNRITGYREQLETVARDLASPQKDLPDDEYGILEKPLAALRVLDDLDRIGKSPVRAELRWGILWSLLRSEEDTLEAGGVDVADLRQVVDSGYEDEIRELQSNIDQARSHVLRLFVPDEAEMSDDSSEAR